MKAMRLEQPGMADPHDANCSIAGPIHLAIF